MSLDARIASLIAFSQSRADAPAPPKDRITGSDKNEEGSAKNKSGDISLDESTISALKKKVEEHNAAMRERKRPEWTHVRLPSLKAVYRRGAGAFSTSHRPGMTRDRWAMARVNAFLTLARRGRPENSKYVGDNDLLHSDHPRHSNQSRAMGTGTNAGGGALAGAADCGRDEDGKFGSGNKCAGGGPPSQSATKPSWMGETDASGTTSHGTWWLEKNEKQGKSPGHGEVTSHVIRLVGKDGKVKAFSYADLSDDKKDLYMNYSEVVEPLRGQGVYKGLLDSLSNQFRVTSDEAHNVATPAKKAYESLGGRLNHYGQYVVEKNRKKSSRAFCPTGEGGGVDNSCGGVGGPAIKSKSGGSMPKSKVEDPRNANSWLSPSGEFHPVARERDGGGWNTHHRWAISHGVAGGEEELLSAGWMRVVRLGQSLYAANENGKALTDKQSKSLLAHAAWAGYDDVVHEHAKGRSKTVWSKDGRSVTFDARYASLLAFAQSRDCGRDEDGKFSSGNTCAGGAVAEAAKGAVTGGIKGAITGLLTGGPVVVKPAAAIGAATGAVKGLYDNQMRPTRVKRTIEKLGMTDAKVGNLVEKLGGSPRSTADVKGNSLRLTIRDKEGKKTFHVEVDKKTITVYPRRETGELNAREIERVKKIADEATPKSVSVVVKSSSSSYVARLVKSGFTMAAGHAKDILLATYSTPLVHSVAVDTLQSLKKRRS